MLGLGLSLIKSVKHLVSIAITNYFKTKDNDIYSTASGDRYIHGGTN